MASTYPFAAAVRWPRIPGLGSRIDPQTRLLGNWLLVWVLLLNMAFMPMWFVGGPLRAVPIGVFATIGLIVRNWPAWQRQVIFFAGLVYSTIQFTAGTFNLNIWSLVDSVRFLGEMSPASSPEYLVAGAILAISAIVGMLWARKPMGFAGRRQMGGAVLAVVALIATDGGFSIGLRGHYAREAPNDARFESASTLSGWGAASPARDHRLLVMVESLGQPRSGTELEQRLFALYLTPAVRARYTITTGKTLYYNSTTAGEVRELCGRWSDYYGLVDRPDPGCLPARLRRQGYDTIALHSFEGAFFDRAKWYPNVGFDRRIFRDTLHARGAERCGGVFAGVCDRDVPKQIGALMSAAKKPTFLYWLTVNSHLPVPQGMNLGVDRCGQVSPVLQRDLPMICRQLAIWDAIDRALVKTITADDFPATDILIVGDHMPPYFDRTYRSQFDPEHVPWIRLTPIARGAAPALAKAGTATRDGPA